MEYLWRRRLLYVKSKEGFLYENEGFEKSGKTKGGKGAQFKYPFVYHPGSIGISHYTRIKLLYC